MPYIFDSLYSEEANKIQHNIEEKGNANNDQGVSTIKMMDTILFGKEFQPKKWIFTDLLGRIKSKVINSITINDVIKAFLVSLNDNKKNEFNNEDLMEFLANNSKRSNICFAIVGNTRHFLDITTLSDIKNKFQRGIDALQLYKISTRDFLPYFYYHTLQFKNDGILEYHMISKLSHFVKDLRCKSQRNANFYEEKVQDTQYECFASQMLELSKQIVTRIQQKDPSKTVKSIKITYLIESSNYDLWFIGTEYCYLQSNRDPNIPNKNNASKNRIHFNRSSSQSMKKSKKSFVRKLREDASMNRSMINSLQQEEKMEDIYELSNNQYVTKSELMQGLIKIGQKYGKDNQNIEIKRPRTMQVLNEQKSRQILQCQQESQDSRNTPKEKGRRIIRLFPKYLEKSGSQSHSKFFFGNVSSDRVFKEYQRLRFQKQINNDPTPISQPNITQNSFNQALITNKSIFNMPMSDANQEDITPKSDYPYQDNYYQAKVGEVSELCKSDISQISDQLMLNKDISIFHLRNESEMKLVESQSMKDSVLSHANKSIKNDYLNKSLLNVLKEDLSKIQLGENDLEKSMISLMMMNQNLDNVVVLDRKKTINRIKQKMYHDELRQKLESQQTTESDHIFTSRRRKIDDQETRTYYQWQQVCPEMSSTNNGETYFNVINNDRVKRSKTVTSGFRRRMSKQLQNQRRKPTALSMLQIKGKEANIQSVSKLDLQKQYQEILTQKGKGKEKGTQSSKEKHVKRIENIKMLRRSQKSSIGNYDNKTLTASIDTSHQRVKKEKSEEQLSSKAVLMKIIQDIEKHTNK